MKKIHYIADRFYSSPHPIHINLIGCGGTGSEVLKRLATINHALMLLGRSYLQVSVYDPDVVTNANISRQPFAECDIGRNKAEVLVERLNRFYGFGFEAIPEKFMIENKCASNLYISCVDKVKDRREIWSIINHINTSKAFTKYINEHYYWIDTGNSQNKGQVIISTVKPIPQPKSKYKTVRTLPTVFSLFKNLKEDKTTPSCSLAEALQKQNLTINPMVADWTYTLLWQMLSEYYIQYHAIYINLESFKVTAKEL